ncbi:MAG TPA: TolC family protein, partial [Longimicrobiales bacterium]|nr:TolC family protein [Longimicrobiales bacterium]
PFAGASEWAERQAATGRQDAARAGLEAARAQAQLELEAATVRRDVARMRLDMAERAAEQSREAHRIVARKYDGGLATVLELLDAAAVETQSGLALSLARYTGITTEAEWRRALGLDPAGIATILDTTHPRTD